MDTFLFLLRVILLAIFALAGTAKFFDLPGSKKAVQDFGVPEFLAKPFSILLPIAELLVAVALIFVQTSWFGAIGGAGLLSIFIGGMLYQMWKGNAPDCHCFGQVHSEPVSPKSVIRNGVFLLVALALVVAGRNNQGLNLFESSTNLSQESSMQIIIGLAVVALLAAVVYILKQISEQQVQIMRRIEILEFSSVEGTKEVVREDVALPQEGLNIGAIAPDFTVPDINDKPTSLKDLLSPQKATIFFFVSPTCNPCGALLPEIEAWQEKYKNKLNFVFISNGNAKDNAEKLNGKTFKRILLQKDREVAELYEAKWTPTVVLINADGRIASRIAVGDTAIRQLFEKIETDNAENGILLIPGTNGASKVGQNIPEFELEDITGKQVVAKDLRGKKTLVTYWSTGCGYCNQMLDDLRNWDKAKGQDQPNLVLLSANPPEPLREMGLNSPILLDSGSAIAGELGMDGTPSAVLINEDGKIISEVAVGSAKIWTLIDKK